jgi:hypothetical protein
MGNIVQRVTILAVVMAIVPFLVDLYLPFTLLDTGIAFAKGGGGGGSGGGGGHGDGHGGAGLSHGGDHGGPDSAFGSHGADHQGRSGDRSVANSHSNLSATRLSDDKNRGRARAHDIHRVGNREEARENGQSRRSVGNAVSKAATSTAHAGKPAAQASGFTNLGQAVRSAVHTAQDSSRVSDR